MGNDIMISEFDTEKAVFSRFTWKLIEDTGWYIPTYE